MEAARKDGFLTPVARTTLTAEICHKLTHHLVRGDWSEGQRLPAERELCKQLGVGRASLREALKALEIMGMIETRLGEGTFVCARAEFLSRPLLWAITTGTGESLHELVEVRQLMEVELASLASERATVKDLKAIREQIQRMENAGHDPEVYLDADLHFHLAVARAAHNSILKNALELIRNLMKHDLMGRWIKESLRQDNTGMRALAEHRGIFEAISNGDRATARAVMTQHMKNLGTLYSDKVRTHEPAAWLSPTLKPPVADASNLSDPKEKPPESV